MQAGESALERIETQIALLIRLGETTRRATPVAAHRALDRAAYVILRHLADAGPQNVSALADRLGLDGSTVTRQVSAMQRDGLVVREADPRDGRGTVIAPTGAGLRRMAAVRAARVDVYGQILASWTDDDREQLATLMGRLIEALEAHRRSG
ncbi:MarR family winged helix-turn-helix transcriptional regulator [Phytohabitans kaempferiae]|uniref:MarR family winged helix-turn-helix transcriptional regulator n=1 Tax=Phytohabitans kaempferiae TaxID=1620943 RepID=A0ABV6LYR6_9ACTN